MRTIRLREQESRTVRLSKAELARLLVAERHSQAKVLSVGIQSVEGDLYQVRTGSVVGTLVWSDLAVLIRPKVDVANIFFLLGFRGGLAEWGEGSFPYKEERDLLRAMAWIFDAELRQGLRYGVARGYVGREEGLTTVRGRMAMARQMRIRQSLPLPLECDFQEYSADITLNRVIKAALRRLRVMSNLEPAVALSLRRAEAAFTDVQDVDYPAANVPNVIINRLNQRWESALRLAQLILRAESLADEFGRSRGLSFTVDMNAVFEKFLEEIVCQEARRAVMECRPQARVKLTDEVEMKPDLMIVANGRRLAVGDAKYVDLEPDEWRNANLYQLLAYCVALGLPRGLLVYAAPRPVQSYRVRRANIDLDVTGIDLSEPPRSLEAKTRTAARLLIGQARSLLAPELQISNMQRPILGVTMKGSRVI